MGETKRKAMKSLFLPFDVFERHKTIAKMIKNGETVLDVGGGVNALGRFIRNKIIVANLESGDVLITGSKLPFDDKSFDIVTSIDVIEHVSPKKRSKFLEELLRVAKKRVIFSTPLGTKGHIKSEEELLKIFEKKKVKSNFLKEHLKNGLPSLKELKNYLKSYHFKVFYSGDYRLSFFLTSLDLKSFKNPKINKMFYFLKRFLNFLLNLFYFPISLSEKEEKFTNRVYFLIEKEKEK